ncbi:TetR family transcriptional regulator [Actinocatenispora thailandica]|uniref:TetR family transcriptional regulator n=1 Tax=Actinocatenispora thailandica TaxID=227318 RepID=A0A7R7DN53_9ACTN|nr:TetR/AcrR family transcriptional regulator [Actinocatenispora thailandica]BCJ34825.1 TetR family transcriptional regulator [Actinocatenispora thailandica]
MTSLRNITSGSDTAILDAARESVLQVGVRRTTATEVARRAGVSRMTLYRRFGDVEQLLVALLTREIGMLLADLAGQTDGLGSGRQRLVELSLRGVDRLAADPLLARLIELDPELLLPYLVDRAGTSQQEARLALAAVLAEGQADGSVRHTDSDAVGWVLLVVLQAFVFGARMLAAQTDPATVRTELGILLDRYLAP